MSRSIRPTMRCRRILPSGWHRSVHHRLMLRLAKATTSLSRANAIRSIDGRGPSGPLHRVVVYQPRVPGPPLKGPSISEVIQPP